MPQNHFDRHSWHAKFYTSALKINHALESFAIPSKKIKDIHVIGAAQNMEKDAYSLKVRYTLADVGVPYEAMDEGKYPFMDETLLPCQVEICEPVVFVFEDNSTLELMLRGRDGLLISANEISPDVLDGTNFHNFDSSKVFGSIIGRSIESIEIVKFQDIRELDSKKDKSVTDNVTYVIQLTGEFGVSLSSLGKERGWFTLGLTDPSYSVRYSKIKKIPFGEIKKAVNGKKQVIIVEGHGGGSYFWIMPVKHVREAWRGIEEYRQEEISIEEDDVFEFLYYFLEKYYDDDYPYGDCREWEYREGFQWNLEYNIYTYDIMREMLNDIETCCDLLKSDYDNPKLDELKERFSAYTFKPDSWDVNRQLTEKEEADIVKRNSYVAVEFYERFVRRMRAMMENAKEYNLISFMGP